MLAARHHRVAAVQRLVAAVRLHDVLAHGADFLEQRSLLFVHAVFLHAICQLILPLLLHNMMKYINKSSAPAARH